MTSTYFKLVIAGKRTCNKYNKNVKQVPSEYFDEVFDMLIKDGRDADGKKQ